MRLEYILAGSALQAETYAEKHGWICQPGNRRQFHRPDGENLVPVRYIANAGDFDMVPPDATLHIGPFAGGMPAYWATMINRRKVFNGAACLAREWGELKPMKDAPEDREFMAFMLNGEGWTICERANDHIHYGDGFKLPLSYWVCWRELPTDPPEFLIRAAEEAQAIDIAAVPA